MEYDQEVYNRLIKIQAIKPSAHCKVLHDKKKVQLDKETGAYFENGIAFAKYILAVKDLMKKFNQDLALDEKAMSELKAQHTPQIKLHNWTVIIQELDKIGIIIENDQKSLAVAGDSATIGQFFARINRFCSRLTQNKINLNELAGAPKDQKDKRGKGPTQKKKQIKDGVDILTMSADRPLNDTESSLEAILNSLCKAFSMRPKQAAALLTNNNQFLIHSCVKGVKGKFDPVLNWFQSLFECSKHLSNLLELEVEQLENNTNFIKVLETLSCGLFSPNQDVCHWCYRLCTVMVEDFSLNQNIFKYASEWFTKKEGGLELALHAQKKHPEMVNEFIQFMNAFCTDTGAFENIYKVEMKKNYGSTLTYITAINDLYPHLVAQHSDLLKESSVLSFWIDICLKMTESGRANTNDERLSGLAFLIEIWHNYSDYIEAKPAIVDDILNTLKRGLTERYSPLRIVSICQLFRILEKFSEEKNHIAPTILKYLIQAFTENPNNEGTREMYYLNFIQLFKNFPNIPIGLLVEELIKQIQLSEGDSFEFKLYDFEFFIFAAQHPKLQQSHGIQLLDLLAKVYLNDQAQASAASRPFKLLAERFAETDQGHEFLMSLVTIGISQLLSLEKDAEQRMAEHQEKKKQLELEAQKALGIVEGGGKTRGKNKTQPQTAEKKKGATRKPMRMDKNAKAREELAEVSRRLKKTFVVEIVLKVQSLKVDDINEQMREMLLKTGKNFFDLFGYFNRGIDALLRYWGDPGQVMGAYMRAIEEREQRQREEEERLKRVEEEKQRRMEEEKKRKEEEEAKRRQEEFEAQLAKMSEEQKAQIGYASSNGANSMQLLPYTGGKKMTSQKAKHDIEKIRLNKIERENAQRLQEERKRAQEERARKKLKQEIEKRKIQLGVSTLNQKDEQKNIIFDESAITMKLSDARKLEAELTLVDLNEEEDRDKDAVEACLRKFSKLFRSLFTKYANSGFSSKQLKNFDDMGQKLLSINVAEITKMLKDHDSIPKLITKETLAQIVRLVNTKITKQSTLTALDFNGFQHLMLQLPFYMYSKPPKDLSNMPLVERVKQMLEDWKEATRSRGQNTILYEDPDATGAGDMELCLELNKRLQEDPQYPIPEGYSKGVEKIPIYSYRIPDSLVSALPESQVVAAESLDEIINELFGFHFIEPLVSMQEKARVRPKVQGLFKPKAEALNYMKKIDRKEKKLEPLPVSAAREQRKNDMKEIKPKLNITLKIEVAKHPLKDRPYAQDVAEVLEEVLQAAEKGLTELPPRFKSAPGQFWNEAKQLRKEEEEAYRGVQQRKDSQRRQRDKQIKDKIKTEKEQRIQQMEETKEERQRLEQERREAERKRQEAARKALNDKKEDLKKQREEQKEQLAAQQEEQQEELKKQEAEKRKQRQEYLKTHKNKLQEEFKQKVDTREALEKAKEQLQVKEKLLEQRIRDQMNEFVKEHHDDSKKELQERQEINEFLDKPDVSDVFNAFKNSLTYVHKFYASQEVKPISFTMAKDFQTMNMREFVRFGYQHDIIPVLLQPEDLVLIFRQVVREKQAEYEKNRNADSTYFGDQDWSQTLDFDMFKKALVRISIMAQDKLGGQYEDKLAAKLDAERQKEEMQTMKADKLKKKLMEQKKAEEEEKKKMKEEFEATLKKQKQVSSKTHGSPGKEGTEGEEGTKKKKKVKKEEQVQIDNTKKEQEDAFFEKWIKQREAQGVSVKKRVMGGKDANKSKKKKKVVKKTEVVEEGEEKGGTKGTKGTAGTAGTEGQDEEEEDVDELIGNTLNQNAVQGRLRKTKDIQELRKLQEQAEIKENLSHVKIEERQIRKAQDVSIISAQTILALLKYIGIEPDDDMYKLNAKLNQHRIEIQGQKPTKVKKQTHQPERMGNLGAGGAAAEEAKEEEGDLEREAEA